jgi:hypothetical protein
MAMEAGCIVSRMGDYFLTRGLAMALEAFLLPTTTGCIFTFLSMSTPSSAPSLFNPP